MIDRMDRQAIFTRIEQYERDFRKNSSGKSMPKIIQMFSEDELDVFGFMGMNHVTNPERLRQFHEQEAERKKWYGEEYVEYPLQTPGSAPPLFSYGTLALASGGVPTADVSTSAINAAVAKMFTKPLGQAKVREYDLEIIDALKKRFMARDLGEITKVYQNVKLNPAAEAADAITQFVLDVMKAAKKVDDSRLSAESIERIIKLLNKEVATHCESMADFLHDSTEEKGFSVKQWGEALMTKVSAQVDSGNVFHNFGSTGEELQQLRNH